MRSECVDARSACSGCQGPVDSELTKHNLHPRPLSRSHPDMATPTNSQRARTVQETTTSLPPADILREAKTFFARQSGVYSAFAEQEGPNYITLRGMGGEEVAIGIAPVKQGEGGVTRVTASSYLFDQQIARFLSTLPPASPSAGTAALPQPAPSPADASA